MRDLITSTANPHVKHIRSLVRFRKERTRERLFIAEGVRLVAEILDHLSPHTLLYVPEQLQTTARGRIMHDQIQHEAFAYPTTAQILAELSDVETPQGVIAAVPQLKLTPQHRSLVLILDGVQDPGNVGTLLRSALASGVDQVIALHGSADVWSPKVVRAGMGAHLRMPLLADVTWADIKADLHELAWYAAVQSALLNYDQADWRKPTAIIIGNEANGVSDAVLHDCQPITIPMLGHVESLNAAIAGSVMLFEAARQRRNEELGMKREEK